MYWKRIGMWTATGLFIWLVALLLAGLALGLVNSPSPEQAFVFALGGMLVPLVLFIRYFPVIAGSYLAAVVAWSFLASRFPRLESGRGVLALSLTAYSALVAIVVWWLFPLDRPLAPYVAVLSVVSIVLPRFMLGMPPSRPSA